MSIEDRNIIDALGITPDGKGLVMLISDHLDWKNEYEHLVILQDKINTYIAFWENKQYEEMYKGREFQYGIIEIGFKYKMKKKGKSFLKTVQHQIEKINLKIQIS